MRVWKNANRSSSGGFAEDRKSVSMHWMLGAAAGLLLLAARGTPGRATGFSTPHPAEVPAVKAGLGPCSADFTVTDSSNKPLYDAKIHLTILYGFMNKRKQDLEIGTNSDGKARFEELPEKVKKPLEFHIRVGQEAKTVTQDPANDCHATVTVALGTP